jgi:hypothetical protein
MTMTKPIYTAHYPSFSPFDSIALGELVSGLDSGCRVLEIGSWLGQGSTKVLIDQVRRKNGLVYCVDTWKGNANVKKHLDIVREYDVLATFLQNVALCGGQDIVRTMVMPGNDAAQVLCDAMFDLVFIDADHSYAATLQDIKAWRPKVKPGGILCGHDCEGRPGDFGRERLAAGLTRDTIPGNERFREVHAGVVLACHESFGDRLELWAEKPVKAPDGSLGRSTIWFVRV